MPSRLHTRLTRLEARRPPVPPVVIAAAPWEVPPGYFEEVCRILWATSCFASIEDLAQTVAGCTAPDVVAALTYLLQETPADG